MKFHRVASIAMALALAGSLMVTGFADETLPNQVLDTDQGITNGASDVTMEVVKFEDVLIATVPVEIPLVSDTKGNVTCPDNVKIINNLEDESIVVKGVVYYGDSMLDFGNISEYTDEELQSYTTSSQRVLLMDINNYIFDSDTSKFDPDLYGIDSRPGTGIYTEWASIDEEITGNSELVLDIDAKVSAALFSEEAEKSVIGTLTWAIAKQ